MPHQRWLHADQRQDKYVVSNDIPTATRITCETCHQHSSFDFAGDTNAMVLRTTAPVYLNYNKKVQGIWQQDVPGNIERGEKNWPEVQKAPQKD